MDKKILYIIILIIAAGIAAFLVSRPIDPTKDTPVVVFGTWQSVDDAKFVRQIMEDRTFFDIYDDTLVDSGTWQPFTKNDPVSTNYQLETDALYMELIGQTTKVQFKLISVGTSTLELMMLGGNGTLRFVRL